MKLTHSAQPLWPRHCEEALITQYLLAPRPSPNQMAHMHLQTSRVSSAGSWSGHPQLKGLQPAAVLGQQEPSFNNDLSLTRVPALQLKLFRGVCKALAKSAVRSVAQARIVLGETVLDTTYSRLQICAFCRLKRSCMGMPALPVHRTLLS